MRDADVGGEVALRASWCAFVWCASVTISFWNTRSADVTTAICFRSALITQNIKRTKSLPPPFAANDHDDDESSTGGDSDTADESGTHTTHPRRLAPNNKTHAHTHKT